MTFDINKYKEAYLNEAGSHIKIMNRVLVELEKDTANSKLLHEFFRSVHTLKSLSGTMRYDKSAALCHAMEDVLDAVRHNQLSLIMCADTLFESIDKLSAIIKELSNNEDEADTSYLVQKLGKILHQHHNTDISSSKELLQFESEAIEKIQSIEVKIEELDKLMNLAEEFLVNKMKFEAISEHIDNPDLIAATESLGRLITDLQYHMMHIRLVPIAFIFNRFIRMTRDLAKQQNKKVNLQMEGADIELDRSLINEIAEAISHLIRNSIDHGLETPDIRKNLNKPEQGTIWLKVFRTKEAARIEITDDGSGINVKEIRKYALKNNLIKPNDSDKEVLNKIFNGISTAKSVSEISGRGLGLSIVKLKIESIGGSIEVKTTPGKGTTFVIVIPLTLAIIKTLLVKVGQQIYAIPTEFVERLLTAELIDIKGFMNDESIIFENNNIPIIRLNNLFSIKNTPSFKQPVIIIQKGSERIGVVADELVATKDIIIKPFNRSIKDNKYFAGATLVGSGQLILILDIDYFLQLRKRNEFVREELINATQ